MYFEGTLAAGQSEFIGGGKHSQFFILECDNQYLDVKFTKSDISQVRMYKGVPAEIFYDNAIISNPHSTSIDYKIYCAPIGMKFLEGRNIEAGPLSITGNNGAVNAPLSSEGGSITPVGASIYRKTITGIFEDVISAAANTNGAIIRTALIENSNGGTSGALLMPKNGATYTYLMMAPKGVIDVISLIGEYYLPAGYNLQVSANAGTDALFAISYDIL